MRVGTRIGIVGSGLIGTSIGLALRSVSDVDVLVRDRDGEQHRLAVALGAGRPWAAGERVDHAVLAVPPHAVARVLAALQQDDAADTYSDVASVKATVVAEAQAAGVKLDAFCPAHPIAGRERGGAVAARADLFRDRPWVLCPTPETSAAGRDAARQVAQWCGATVVELDPARHDEVMARLSHVPQLVASLLAGLAGGLDDDELALAGSGLRDTTRLADSDPGLWASIVEGNRKRVAAALSGLADELTHLASVVRDAPAEQVADAVDAVLFRGREARRRLPAKVGQPAPAWAWVGVVVPDQPGQLADLFAAVRDWRVNVEDVRVEHSRRQPRGVLEIAVAPEVAEQLTERLGAAGWTAYRRD